MTRLTAVLMFIAMALAFPIHRFFLLKSVSSFAGDI